MQFHSNTDPLDVAYWLREQAAARGMPPNFLYALDDMADAINSRTELAELEDKACELENAKDDLWGELSEATDALRLASEMLTYINENPQDPEIDADELRQVCRAVDIAEKALERHGDKPKK